MVDYTGQPCRNCGNPSIKWARLCRTCRHDYDREWARKRRSDTGIPIRRKRQKLLVSDIVMPTVLKSERSKDLLGKEMAGTEYTRGYIRVTKVNRFTVTDQNDNNLLRELFEFRLVYRRQK